MSSSVGGEPPPRPERKRKARDWAEKAHRPKPYNPLDLDQLGRSVELRLLEEPVVPLVDVPPMIGAGVYAIYYNGDHDLYRSISSSACERPIYVGKALPRGGRKGLSDMSGETSALWDRLQEHKESLQQAFDLDEHDFLVRYLVGVEVFVPLAERVMIQRLSPVWNRMLDGFGNHEPGAGRRNQARSPWDEVHPGRWWSDPRYMPTPSKLTKELAIERIKAHLAGVSAPEVTLDAVDDTRGDLFVGLFGDLEDDDGDQDES